MKLVTMTLQHLDCSLPYMSLMTILGSQFNHFLKRWQAYNSLEGHCSRAGVCSEEVVEPWQNN